MKGYSQLEKIISLLMIFILLIQLSGCVSYQPIISSDLPLPNASNYKYIIHYQNSKYLLENTVISNGILSGKIDVEGSPIGSKIHVYLSSDSVMKISTEKILSVPIDGITRVELGKAERGKTALLITGCSVSLLVILMFLALMNWDFGIRLH